jgi:diguanylate cyclase (GGDEF)-like protein
MDKEHHAPALVYLVHNNALLAADLAQQIRCFGYEVVVVGDCDRLAAAASGRAPAALIIDLDHQQGMPLESAAVARIRQSSERRVPLLCLSGRNHFDACLAAVRAGADAYCARPVDATALVDHLDALIERREVQPYRLLAVGSDAATTGRYAELLRGPRIELMRLHRLMDVFKALGEYRPELVLVDVDTPRCSGRDLIRLIRQNSLYVDLPIVAVAHSGAPAQRIAAIEAGADDVLLPPLESDCLAASLAGRAERYRTLRGLIMRDSLTGLYNHSASKEHLAREIARARREQAPLSLAMIDIDYFKRVNDSYGHPVGDQVIRALSRLLVQRLRRGDIVGRYGGEEFVAILPATGAAAAAAALDQVREAFSGIRHRADEREFATTFSAGIADLTVSDDAAALSRAADTALYAAKHMGRNRVEIADLPGL